MKHRHRIPTGVRYYVKAKHAIRHAGVSALLRQIIAKAARTAYRTTCSLWLVRTSADRCEPVNPRTPVTLDYLESDKTRLIDWLRMNHRIFPWMFFPREVEAAIANGHIFAAINYSGEIIGYIKIGINEIYIHDFDRIISFPPGVAFVYDTFVLPAYRNKRIALHAIMKTIKFLKDRGYTKLWCHIEKWNAASLRLYRKAGFKEKGTIRFSAFFTLPLFIRDGYKPFSGWERFLTSL